MKIKYTHQIKAVPLPIDLTAKTANEHLRILQSNAIKERAFYIIPVSKDLFDKSVPVVYFDDELNKHDSGQLRKLFFNRITKGNYPNLMFILSALDPQRISRCIPEGWKDSPPANVMYDLRIQDQLSAETLIPQYLKIKGNKAITIFSQSAEISMLPWLQTGKIDWLKQISSSIGTHGVGWAQKIRSECNVTNIPYCPVLRSIECRIPTELLVEKYPDELFNSAYAICNTPPKRKPVMKGIPFEDIFG